MAPQAAMRTLSGVQKIKESAQQSISHLHKQLGFREEPPTSAESRSRTTPAATVVILGPDFSKPLQQLRRKAGQDDLAVSGPRLSRKTSIFDLRGRKKREIVLQEGRERDHERYIERETCMRALLYEDKLASAASQPAVQPVVEADKQVQTERTTDDVLELSKVQELINHTIMSSDNATSPVPESRLQEITVEACEKALSTVTAYSHGSTKEWNTTIINAILSTLVSETTATGSSGQPAFKYVVNSTIIQHAPTHSSGSSDVALTGRRGMHAASGAYWNNEKDGMWSYQYSAAEKKGLDVVVGVTWIYVG